MATVTEIQFALAAANQVKKQWRESIDNLTPELFEHVLGGKPSEFLSVYEELTKYFVVYGPDEGLTYGEIYLKEEGFNFIGFKNIPQGQGKSAISFTVPKNHIINDLINKVETKPLDIFIQTTLTSTNFKKLEYGDLVHRLYKNAFIYTLICDKLQPKGHYLYCVNKLKELGYKNVQYYGSENISFTI